MSKKIVRSILSGTMAAALAVSMSVMPVSAACGLTQNILDFSKLQLGSNCNNTGSCNSNKGTCGATTNNGTCNSNSSTCNSNTSTCNTNKGTCGTTFTIPALPSSVPESVIKELTEKLTAKFGFSSTCPNGTSNDCPSGTCDTDKKDCTGTECDIPAQTDDKGTDKKDDTPVIPVTPDENKTEDIITDSDFSKEAEEILKLVNTERAAAGLAPLTLEIKLCEAADIRATEITKSFSHTRPDGTSCFTAVKEVGYTDYRALGENIAAGQKTPEAVMNGWMNSSGHKANILSANFTKLGLGYVKTSSGYGHYWVQMFAG